MEFRFSIGDIFPSPISEINQSLLPNGYCASKTTLFDATTKVSEIINAMGIASAKAQGLAKPITTSDKLRNSDHTIYLLADRNAKSGKGVVTGMLKTGRKNLYLYDRGYHQHQVTPPCVLDFYVHESRQRTGLGKQLFENMLQVEKLDPVKLAIDKPSNKMLSFLNKHYGLRSAFWQMNHYVIFDGFFTGMHDKNRVNRNGGSSERTRQSTSGLRHNLISPSDRYGAPRRTFSMGQI